MTPRQAFLGILFLNALAVAVTIGMGAASGNFASKFGEKKFITWFSGIQLATVGWLSLLIFKARRSNLEGSAWRSPVLLWGLAAFGFFFLAADELGRIHEKADRWIHFLLNMKETALTDRIDDLIVGLYGVGGLVILCIYRGELKLFRSAIPFLAGGFVLLFSMVALDAITNRSDVLLALFSADRVALMSPYLIVLEESFKVLGEACFLIAFYCVYLQTKAPDQPTP